MKRGDPHRLGDNVRSFRLGYLPSWFRTYRVSNYARYGLPPPPYACVWLLGDAALIDRSDGYILDIARNVW